MAVSSRVRKDPQIRREAILAQAVSLIAERGYDGLTIGELAKRCELSNAGLLHYFSAKSEVLLAVLHDLEAREGDAMAPLVAAAVEAPAERSPAAVREVLRAIVMQCATKPEIARALVELQGESLDSSHPGHAWWRNREEQMIRLFVLLLTPYLAEPEAVARQVIAMIDGLAMQWLRANEGFNLIAEWDRAVARLLPEIH